jgi:hypothetical protein
MKDQKEVAAARLKARELAVHLKPIWSDLTSSDRCLRREIVRILSTQDEGENENIRDGIAGALLFAYAQNGDQAAYDLARDLGYPLEGIKRPKRQGGRPQAGLRDFIILFLSELLMRECPDISWGANSATEAATSAVDIIRSALEDEGMAVIDYKAALTEEPEPRAAERAVKRMLSKDCYFELFDPEWSEAYDSGREAGHEISKRILSHDP